MPNRAICRAAGIGRSGTLLVISCAMSNRHRPCSRTVLSLAAALLLAMQSALMAFSSVAHAAPAVDFFGNPLCLGAGEEPDQAPAVPNCCAFGCNLSAGASLPHPPALSAPAEIRGTVALRLAEDRSIGLGQHSPARPRAPPAA